MSDKIDGVSPRFHGWHPTARRGDPLPPETLLVREPKVFDLGTGFHILEPGENVAAYRREVCGVDRRNGGELLTFRYRLEWSCDPQAMFASAQADSRMAALGLCGQQGIDRQMAALGFGGTPHYDRGTACRPNPNGLMGGLSGGWR